MPEPTPPASRPSISSSMRFDFGGPLTDPTRGHETCHHRIYSLTCTAYETLLARSAGRCELCSKSATEEYNGKLVIDHESRIGWEAIRGLLCQKCNAHMRRVDRAERPMSKQVFTYLDLSGHFVTPGADFRWSGVSAEVRVALLVDLTASAGAGQGGRRAKPRLACAPRAVLAPW
jgi:hypothetical protein